MNFILKIAHISDIHIGYSSGKKKDETTKVNLRELDGYNALNECLDSIIEQKPDIVLCTGDFFHSPNPSIYTLVEGQKALSKLVEAKIPFYNIAGNHDATDSVKDVPANRILHSPALHLYSYVEPYVKVELKDNVVLHLVSHHHYSDQRNTMDILKPIEGKFNILCTHGSCFDPFLDAMLHSEASPREVIIPEDILKLNWDYILLGHIHERGWVGSADQKTDTTGNKIFYGGSLIRRGFSDKECPLGRGWTMWTIENSQMKPTFYNVQQRTQLDEMIFCDRKSPIDIEKEIKERFQKIDLSEIPIVRFTLVDLTNIQKMQIDWKKFAEYTSRCLTFGTRIKTKEQIKKELSTRNFSFDLIEAFSEYWEETKDVYDKDDRTNIKTISQKLLKQGQSNILSKE